MTTIDLFSLAFGAIPRYNPSDFKPVADPSELGYGNMPSSNGENHSLGTVESHSENGRLEKYNRRVFHEAWFTGLNGSSTFEYRDGDTTRQLEELKLPAASVVDFSRQKTVVKTPVAGRNGTVKELVGAEDWRIRIRGVITSEGYAREDEYPHGYVRRLKAWLDAPTALPVVGEIFTTFGVSSVVVEGYDFPKLEGFPGVQAFTIDCVSDEPTELVLREDSKINSDL